MERFASGAANVFSLKRDRTMAARGGRRTTLNRRPGAVVPGSGAELALDRLVALRRKRRMPIRAAPEMQVNAGLHDQRIMASGTDDDNSAARHRR